jgi:hypothetical protein
MFDLLPPLYDHLTIVSIWAEHGAWRAHGKSPSARQNMPLCIDSHHVKYYLG